MTKGYRIERFRFKSARTVRQKAPWARAVYRLGPCLHIAYECPEDALEEFGAVTQSDAHHLRTFGATKPEMGGLNMGLIRAAKRRGDL